MRLEIQQGLDGLKKIEQEWNILFKKIKEPVFSQSIIWHRAYLKNLSLDSEKCCFFCIYKYDILIAIFPFEIFRRRYYLLSFDTLGFSTHSHFGLNSILMGVNEDSQVLFEFLFKELKKNKKIKWNLIYLERVLKNSKSANCLIQNSIKSYSNDCLVIPIETEDVMNTRLSRNFKSNIKRKRKKLFNYDLVKFESIKKTEDLESAFHSFLDIEASGWKGLAGTKSAIKLDDNLKGFYEDVLREFSLKNQIEINLLKINNDYVAAQFTVVIDTSIFLFKLGYREEFKELSPGYILLHQKLLDYSKQSILKRVNCISNASWFLSYKPEIVPCINIYNCRNNRVSFYFNFILWIIPKLKIIRSKMTKSTPY